MVIVIDYGMGNVGSIFNMLKKIGANCMISSKPDDIIQATKIILPGVGLFGTGMERLRELNLIPILEQRALADKIPVLGICLGMQLFTERSEESNTDGLGWIKGETIRFRFANNSNNLKIPHMGWNEVSPKQDSLFFNTSQEKQRFYFLHSYHVVCRDKDDALTETNHGYSFISAIKHNNLLGVQFHPEKSHKFGMEFFKKFMECI